MRLVIILDLLILMIVDGQLIQLQLLLLSEVELMIVVLRQVTGLLVAPAQQPQPHTYDAIYTVYCGTLYATSLYLACAGGANLWHGQTLLDLRAQHQGL